MVCKTKIMDVLNLFTQPVASFKLKEDLQKLEKFCLNLKDRHPPGLSFSNRGGFHSDYLNLKDKHLQSFIIALTKSYSEYAKLFNFKNPLNILGLWANINEYKDSNAIHYHPDSLISGVFYVKAKNNSGSIQFYNQDIVNHCIKPSHISKYNELNSSTWGLEPEENTLLLFPSWLKHEVLPNLSALTRISISFNIGGCYKK